MSDVIRVPHLIPPMGTVAAMLVEYLKPKKHGDTATDAELAAVAGESVATGGRYAGQLQTAIKFLRKHYHVHWKRQPKAGYIKCLDIRETHDVVRGRARGAQRAARRSLEMMECHDPSALPQSERAEYIATCAQQQLIAMAAQSAAHKALTDKARHGLPEIKLPDLLAAVKNE